MTNVLDIRMEAEEALRAITAQLGSTMQLGGKGAGLRVGDIAFTGTKISKPWDIKITHPNANLTDCVFMRGAVTTEVTIAQFAITKAYIGVKITPTLSGYTTEILQGDTLADITDADAADVDESIKIPLYKVAGSAATQWRVACDYRNVLGAGLYW